MTALEFLSLRGEATPRSPLDRALRPVPPGVRLLDLSLELAKLEVRGDLGAVAAGELIRITPRRGLVVAPIEEAETIEAALRSQVATVIDRTGALAALRIEGPRAATLMRRLTDLDLEALPAAGAVARVPTIVRDGFELFWAQEYGHYLVEVVVDTAQGLA